MPFESQIIEEQTTEFNQDSFYNQNLKKDDMKEYK